MLPLVENTILILVACAISACVTVILLRKNNENASEIIQTRITTIRDEVQDLLNTEFDKFRPLISRAMSIVGNAGAQAKKVQAFEREAMRAVQDDLPITPDMIRSFSPKLGEMIDENPALLIQGREILQKIWGNGSGSTARARVERRPEV